MSALTDEEIIDRLRKMIKDRLTLDIALEDFKSDLLLFGEDGLGLDSVEALDITVGIENEFGVTLEGPEEEEEEAYAAHYKTLETLRDFVKELKAEQDG